MQPDRTARAANLPSNWRPRTASTAATSADCAIWLMT